MRITKFVLKKWWSANKIKDDERIAKLKKPAGIDEVLDIDAAGKGNVNNFFDVYIHEDLPKDELLPVIIDIHGGGWTYGQKELNKMYCLDLALRGFAIVNINYHLLWDGDMPQMFKDIFDVFNYIYDHGAELRLDRDNVFLTGDSAGGHLSVASAALIQNDKLKKLLGVDTKLKLNAIATTCGAINMEKFTKSMILSGFRKMCFGKKPTKHPLYSLLTPMEFIDPKTFPPVFISTGSDDFIRTHSFVFKDFCEEKGIPYQFFYGETKEGGNKLEHVYNITHPDWDEAKEVNDAQCEFYRKYLV